MELSTPRARSDLRYAYRGNPQAFMKSPTSSIAAGPSPSRTQTLPNGPSPLYSQIAQVLREQILKGEFQPGSVLPTEESLCETYGVSRSTVRQAMGELLSQRLVLRRRGVGTYVAERKRAQRIAHPVGSIYDALHYVGNVKYQVLSKLEAVPPEGVGELLRLEDDEKCLCVSEMGFFDKQPFVCAELYFRLRFGRSLESKDLASGTPLVRLVEQRFGLRVSRAEQVVEPESASAAVAKILGIHIGTPILRNTRVYFLADSSSFGASVTHFHPERYKMHIELVERPPA
jgi:GntR family transcriptional regulator